MPFLPTLGSKDAATARSIGRSTRVPSTASRLGGYDIAKAVEDGFDRVVWPFRCADAIGLNQSKLRMVVREGDDPFEGEEVEDHRLLPLLNGQANPYETATAFRYRLSCQLLVSNRGVFVERVDSRMGDPLELHLLPPHQTKPIPPADPRSVEGLRAFVDHFEVRIGGKARPDKLDPEDVVWIRKPHPLDPYRSLTPLEQAGLAVDVAFWAKVYIRNYLGNDGRGAAVLAFAEAVDDADIDELDARMNAGPGRAGRTAIIDQVGADGLQHIDLASSPGEWYSTTGEDVRDECLIAFGTPLTVLGQAAERTFANADAETDVFWRETMLGHLRFVSTAMDPLLGAERSARIIGWDLSQVEVLQRDKRERDEHALEEFTAGAINLDQYNEMVGREPVGGRLGQTYFLPMARVPFIPGEREPAGRGGGRGEEEPGEEPGDDPPEPPGEAVHGGLGVKQSDDDVDDPWFEVREAAGARFDRWERAVHDVAVRWFERVGEIVVARLTGKQGRRGTRHYNPPGEKQIDPERVFPRSRFSDEFVDDMTDTLERLYDEVGSDVADTLDATFNRTDPAVAESITTRSNRLSGVVDETWERVADAIAAGERAGESIDDIADRVRDEFSFASRVRARTIARTEVVSAANDASLQAARQSGGVTAKLWLTSRDPRVRGTDPGDRFSHVAMDGVKVPVDQRFNVSGELLDYPGDPAGSGGNVINCRCTLVYERGV